MICHNIAVGACLDASANCSRAPGRRRGRDTSTAFLRMIDTVRPAARKSRPRKTVAAVEIPRDIDGATLTFGGRDVRLTNLRKIFWPELGLTKGDLLQYYATVAPALL